MLHLERWSAPSRPQHPLSGGARGMDGRQRARVYEVVSYTVAKAGHPDTPIKVANYGAICSQSVNFEMLAPGDGQTATLTAAETDGLAACSTSELLCAAYFMAKVPSQLLARRGAQATADGDDGIYRLGQIVDEAFRQLELPCDEFPHPTMSEYFRLRWDSGGRKGLLSGALELMREVGVRGVAAQRRMRQRSEPVRVSQPVPMSTGVLPVVSDAGQLVEVWACPRRGAAAAWLPAVVVAVDEATMKFDVQVEADEDCEWTLQLDDEQQRHWTDEDFNERDRHASQARTSTRCIWRHVHGKCLAEARARLQAAVDGRNSDGETSSYAPSEGGDGEEAEDGEEGEEEADEEGEDPTDPREAPRKKPGQPPGSRKRKPHGDTPATASPLATPEGQVPEGQVQVVPAPADATTGGKRTRVHRTTTKITTSVAKSSEVYSRRLHSALKLTMLVAQPGPPFDVITEGSPFLRSGTMLAEAHARELGEPADGVCATSTPCLAKACARTPHLPKPPSTPPWMTCSPLPLV
jgi:hypothetical protein